MFTLVLIDDDIPVQPSDFRGEYRLQVKKEIQCKYVDRVIPNVGLCVEFYDFHEFRDAIVYPGDGKLACGEAYFKVEFNMIVFRPIANEWLVGCISGSSEKGLSVTLGFFHDVEVPSSNLRTPYTFDAVRQVWVWQYRNLETRESINFFYEKEELLRFRVISVIFPEAGTTQKDKKETPMRIVGAVDLDGLGCMCWWPEAD
mmetsp:Transcript_32173/g.94006  ORF Transcript_32173/g.94006 Transcript_32173/m.94006 type:complete len:201 (+) Transcript_32173:113-715(+)